MGLDSIWHVPEGVEHPKLQVSLCGGMFSGPSDGQCISFRGKVYSDFIQEVTGFTLYEDTITGEELEALVESLANFKDGLDKAGQGYGRVIYLRETFGKNPDESLEYGLNDLSDLLTMFEAYASIEGAELKSWY